MFPIGNPSQPANTPELLTALEHGAKLFQLSPAIFSANGSWPGLESLKADFTGASLPPTFRLPMAQSTQAEGFFARELEITAVPLHAWGMTITFRLNGADVVLNFGTAADQQPVLSISKCSRGELNLEIPLSDLQHQLQKFAAGMAQKQGAEVQSTELELQALDSQTLALSIYITAKAMFMTARVNVAGRVKINENLDAHFSALQCRGDGMAGNMAASFIKPHFEKLEGRTIPLAGFLPQNLHLHSPSVSCGDKIALRAMFDVQ